MPCEVEKGTRLLTAEYSEQRSAYEGSWGTDSVGFLTSGTTWCFVKKPHYNSVKEEMETRGFHNSIYEMRVLISRDGYDVYFVNRIFVIGLLWQGNLMCSKYLA